MRGKNRKKERKERNERAKEKERREREKINRRVKLSKAIKNTGTVMFCVTFPVGSVSTSTTGTVVG